MSTITLPSDPCINWSALELMCSGRNIIVYMHLSFPLCVYTLHRITLVSRPLPTREEVWVWVGPGDEAIHRINFNLIVYYRYDYMTMKSAVITNGWRRVSKIMIMIFYEKFNTSPWPSSWIVYRACGKGSPITQPIYFLYAPRWAPETHSLVLAIDALITRSIARNARVSLVSSAVGRPHALPFPRAALWAAIKINLSQSWSVRSLCKSREIAMILSWEGFTWLLPWVNHGEILHDFCHDLIMGGFYITCKVIPVFKFVPFIWEDFT